MCVVDISLSGEEFACIQHNATNTHTVYLNQCAVTVVPAKIERSRFERQKPPSIYDDRVTNPVKVGLMRFQRDECIRAKSFSAVTRDNACC